MDSSTINTNEEFPDQILANIKTEIDIKEFDKSAIIVPELNNIQIKQEPQQVHEEIFWMKYFEHDVDPRTSYGNLNNNEKLQNTKDYKNKSLKKSKKSVKPETNDASCNVYQCTDCSKTFMKLGGLKQHSRIHTGRKPYKCDHCLKTFTQQSHLNQHVRLHTGEKPYNCKECNMSFRQLSHLQHHYRRHEYNCSYCDCKFYQSSNLKEHLKIHSTTVEHMNQHSSYEEYKKPSPYLVDLENKRGCCMYCQQTFNSLNDFNCHLKICKKQIDCIDGENKTDTYFCSECETIFDNLHNFDEHVRIHSGYNPYSCNECSKQFGQLSELQHHKRKHLKQKRYKCEICDIRFSQLSHLIQHDKEKNHLDLSWLNNK